MRWTKVLQGIRLMKFEEILDRTRSRELARGDPLFDEGEPAEHLFNVTTGAVKIYKLLADGRRQMTGFHDPGSRGTRPNRQTKESDPGRVCWI